MNFIRKALCFSQRALESMGSRVGMVALLLSVSLALAAFATSPRGWGHYAGYFSAWFWHIRPWPDFAALAHARTQMIDGDHDVFGDGTVILKYAPGHTPGHQCLFVQLVKTGGVLIAGDLYHYAEERTLHRMPTDEQTTATPASRAKIEDFVKEKRAQLWIGHSTSFFRDAIKSPGWYE